MHSLGKCSKEAIKIKTYEHNLKKKSFSKTDEYEYVYAYITYECVDIIAHDHR